MSYTPTIIFEWADVTPKQIKEAQERREDDQASREFADELLSFCTEPKWLKTFKGKTFASLFPDLSSHTTHYREQLRDWKIEFFEVGG